VFLRFEEEISCLVLPYHRSALVCKTQDGTTVASVSSLPTPTVHGAASRVAAAIRTYLQSLSPRCHQSIRNTTLHREITSTPDTHGTSFSSFTQHSPPHLHIGPPNNPRQHLRRGEPRILAPLQLPLACLLASHRGIIIHASRSSTSILTKSYQLRICSPVIQHIFKHISQHNIALTHANLKLPSRLLTSSSRCPPTHPQSHPTCRLSRGSLVPL
jgi:hypothetical protein